jgi:hypothetical protein
MSVKNPQKGILCYEPNTFTSNIPRLIVFSMVETKYVVPELR